ncbi:MAG: thioredoxin family protein [Rhizobium sp.]|nr:thioredoxin family protein [Rhizobium sp.]
MIFRIASGLAVCCTIAVAFAARADDAAMPKGVVELFTSQGCSSCPPADAALQTLARKGEVVALSYHVDYWNYLGWADTLATPENTARQYAYARSLGRSGVYTPQAVVNGRDHLKGTDAEVIEGRLDGLRARGHGLTVPIHAGRRGDEIEISIGAGNGKADVVVVYFRQQQTVEVLKGENTGKTISYWNSVIDVQTVAMWDGEALDLVLPAKMIGSEGADGCAVLLQSSGPHGEPAAIRGAALLTTEPRS